MVFKCPTYHRICLSYPTKEQSSSAPPVFNKDLLKTFFCKPIAHKCYISSFKLFRLVQTPVFIAVSDFSARTKKSFETLHFCFNFPHPTQAKVKIPHSLGIEDGQMPGFARGKGGGDVEVLI